MIYVDPQGLSGTLVLPRPIIVPRPISMPTHPYDPVLPIPDTANPADTLPNDPGNNNSRDPCKGLRDQLRAYEQKLRDYRANPDDYDNKGFLKNAPPDRRQDIIYRTSD